MYLLSKSKTLTNIEVLLLCSKCSILLSDYTAVFGAGDHDDGASPEFTGMNFEHSDALQNMFRQVFGLKEFRHNQLPAINAALLGKDCFILMPTGKQKEKCLLLILYF